MNNNGSLPVEVGIEKAKREILRSINMIGRSYDLPSSIMVMIIEQILLETKINTFETIVSNYDMVVPKGIDQKEVLKNDDVIMEDVE